MTQLSERVEHQRVEMVDGVLAHLRAVAVDDEAPLRVAARMQAALHALDERDVLLVVLALPREVLGVDVLDLFRLAPFGHQSAAPAMSSLDSGR